MSVRSMPRPRRALMTAAVVVGVVLLVSWFALLRPQTLGGSTGYVIVVGDSMEPTLSADDLVVLRRHRDYGPGDVIAYTIPDSSSDAMVIHRVIGGNARDGYVTRGDNRAGTDQWRPRPSDIVGAQSFHVPAVGGPLRFLSTPVGLSVVIGALTFSLALVRREPSPDADDVPEVEATVSAVPACRRTPAPHVAGLRPRGAPLTAPSRTAGSVSSRPRGVPLTAAGRTAGSASPRLRRDTTTVPLS